MKSLEEVMDDVEEIHEAMKNHWGISKLWHILCEDNWDKEAENILEPHLYHLTGTGLSLEGDWQWTRAEGLITTLNKKYDAQYLSEKHPNLKFIASVTTGVDHIDTEYAKQKGIKIISLQGETEFLRNVHATAEHTMALMLSLIRKIPAAHKDITENGNWDRELFQGIELKNRTLGVVGMGRVGHQVRKFAETFGMHVIFYDIRYIDNPFVAKLPYILHNSDIVSIHIPLNITTEKSFGIKEFQQMKPTTYFINTSRGQIVEENALLEALRNKWIAGAALDVVCNEPNINPELVEYARQNQNLLLTSHLGGNTVESRKSTQIFIANRIKEYIENQC